MSDLKPAVTGDELKARLNRLPRLSLADLPTPLTDCPRLSESLGGPRILVKREDSTGMAFGGNKVRELEYSVAPAVAEGYDVLLHGAASQSNQSRITAAVAARSIRPNILRRSVRGKILIVNWPIRTGATRRLSRERERIRLKPR